MTWQEAGVVDDPAVLVAVEELREGDSRIQFSYLSILLLEGLSCNTMDLRTGSGHVECWMFVGYKIDARYGGFSKGTTVVCGSP